MEPGVRDSQVRCHDDDRLGPRHRSGGAGSASSSDRDTAVPGHRHLPLSVPSDDVPSGEREAPTSGGPHCFAAVRERRTEPRPSLRRGPAQVSAVGAIRSPGVRDLQGHADTHEGVCVTGQPEGSGHQHRAVPGQHDRSAPAG